MKKHAMILALASVVVLGAGCATSVEEKATAEANAIIDEARAEADAQVAEAQEAAAEAVAQAAEEAANDVADAAQDAVQDAVDSARESIKNSIASMTTTDTGLQYEDAVEGTGATAEAGQSVTVHYVGQFEDGTQFDSSRDRGTPFTFNLGAGQVIKGWDEGVAGMKVGGTRNLVIPSDLGYGDRDYAGIPGGSTLYFEVELLEVE